MADIDEYNTENLNYEAEAGTNIFSSPPGVYIVHSKKIPVPLPLLSYNPEKRFSPLIMHFFLFPFPL